MHMGGKKETTLCLFLLLKITCSELLTTLTFLLPYKATEILFVNSLVPGYNTLNFVVFTAYPINICKAKVPKWT